MENELQQSESIAKRATAIEAMAARLQVSKEVLQSTLKATAFRECKTNEEFVAAVIVANTYRLNPLLREITAFPGKSGGVVPVVMVDGWIKLVQNHPEYDGVEIVENEEPSGKPNKSGTTVKSITSIFYVKGKSKPVIVMERMDECFDGSKTPWQKWPVRMLRHKAYIQGARVAFGFSGIYDEDEAERIISSVPTSGKPHVFMPQPVSAFPDETTAAPAHIAPPQPVPIIEEESPSADEQEGILNQEIRQAEAQAYPPPAGKTGLISDSQAQSLHKIAKQAGIGEPTLKSYLKRTFAVEYVHHLSRSEYNLACQWVMSGAR